MSKRFRVIALICTFVLVVVATVSGVLAAKVVSSLPLGSTVMNVESLDSQNTDVGMLNFLVLGIDEDHTRSDTIMLFCYDGYSNRINMMSFPRDTMVKINGYYQKLNAAMGVGLANVNSGKDTAPEEEVIRQIKQMTGLPIHYFVTVDFDGFKEIIDTLGGVDFDVPYNMNYDDPVQDLHIHLKAGPQHLDGQAAHDFVRFRHNNDGSAPGEYVMGDEGRIYWQQQFMKELFRQKMTPQLFTRITDLFEVVADNLRTNFTLQDLLKHVGVLQKIDFNAVESYQLPGEARYINGVSWYIQDVPATDKLVDDVFLPRTKEQWEQDLLRMEAEKQAEEAAQNPQPTATAAP